MLAKIFIKPKKGILDPQGKAVSGALERLGFGNIKDVKVGKYIEVAFDETEIEQAKINVQKMCETLLVNKLIEDYTFDVVKD